MKPSVLKPLFICIFISLIAGCHKFKEVPQGNEFKEGNTVVDSGQIACYNNLNVFSCPGENEAFYGQDAQYDGIQPSYQYNGDGTITDLNTWLMWQQNDSGKGLNWEQALVYAENLEHSGYNDWRLPNAKELQNIVDYTRSPDTTNSGAIDPLFETTSIINEAGQTDYPFYWTGTTHKSANGLGVGAVYISFGRAMGYMGGQWLDVHGAGAQRSDPKSGNPANFPNGRGPQGDAIRIYNYVRCVRNAN